MREQLLGIDITDTLPRGGGGSALLQRSGEQRTGFANGFYDQAPHTPTVQEVTQLLDEHVARTPEVNLGPVVKRYDIPSSIDHFNTMPGYKVAYPDVVKKALGNVFAEYNHAFTPSVDTNREWATDYQYALDHNAHPLNRWVQVDMVGLPDEFLKEIAHLPEALVRKLLKRRIFEIENSLAMYNVMRGIFADQKNSSPFTTSFDASLDALREKYNMPIAVLAVTDPKYHAIKATEFGKRPDENLSNRETKALSGFDKVFGPTDFADHLRRNDGKSGYLLYVRASDPVEELKKPGKSKAVNPFLANPQIRRAVKEAALTFNIDQPGVSPRINDTKAYLARMGMAYRADTPEQAFTLDKQQPPQVVLHPDFKKYLIDTGVDPVLVESGQLILRAKPEEAAYGGYGHIVFDTTSGSSRQEVKGQMRKRGSYTFQQEHLTPTIVNTANGEKCTYIDRNMLVMKENGQVELMTGFRMMMPIDTTEAAQHRVHGNIATRFVQIA